MKRTFPLFRLPENAIVQVLQNMDLKQLLIISLVSTKSKNFVISIGLRARSVYTDISRTISLTVAIGESRLALDFFNDSNDQNELLSVDQTLPVDALLLFEDETIQSPTPFNFSKWLNHMRTVFCYTKQPDVRFFRNCERFDVRSLKNTYGNVGVLYVASEVTNVYTKEVLEHFNASNELSLERNPFDESCEVQQFFIQNYERMGFHDVYSLDDMLLVNSEEVIFYHPSTQKQFNKFIKHWICGSNTRLQHMSVSIDTTNSVIADVLLKGIKCIRMCKDAKKEIRRKHDIGGNCMVQIRRDDGTPAVIALDKREYIILNVHLIVLY